ncbi:alpha/beta hydrolase family protein [Flavobacterium sp. W21_SRS_FM6]|uniref:alpha/beta hydrolase family protein n=1 Tax=Flavobacterium sp. W21_SRS_FM6 TaxID=3240268 RepID=UPI003F906918
MFNTVYQGKFFNAVVGMMTCAILFSASAPAQKLEPQKLYSKQPSVMPELALPGQYKVGVSTIQATHPQQLSATDFKTLQDRTLTLEVWYPATPKQDAVKTSYENVSRLHIPFSLAAEAYRDAPQLTDSEFPLVVLSHGYTGYRTIMYYLGEHLASHGYVVVGIDHTDSTTGEIDFTKAPFAGFVSTLMNRARDQQFVLDYFSEASSPFAAVIDSDKAAVIGYSMGGYGAVNTIGGCYNFTQAGLQQFGFPEAAAQALMPVFNSCNAGRETVDPRWKAMVAFAPWGQELNIHSEKSLANIKVPSMFVSGDYDDVSGYEKGVRRLYEQSGSKESYLMVYQNARHNIAPHPAPQETYATDIDIGHYFEPSWSSETLNRINQHMTLAFLDCKVKADANACGYLPVRELSNQVKDDAGKLSAPWPGFKDRWGTGVMFLRKDQP